MNKEELWQAALADIEISISKANFLTWFRNTSVVSKKDGVVTLGVPNTFTREWLENKYNKLILRSLRNLVGEIKEVKFNIHSQNQDKDKKGLKTKEEVVVFENQLNFPEVETDSETNLNPRYTFDSFVVASSNELAHAASLAVSNDLGMVYNPLFLYGGVGLGKTHLLQAIGNEIIKKSEKKKIVRYVSSERFTHEVVTAIRTGTMEKFKKSYQEIDLLILDDVQFLAGKEKTQEEFFHTFNALYEKNKQIVLSSDRPPKAIPTLEDRLRSRFEGGMIADVTQPDYETRLAILRTKSAEKKFGIEEDILNILAEKVTANVRELEGALNRVVATAQLTGNPPSVDKIKKILDSSQKQNKNKLTPKTIIRVVSDFYDVKEEDLINKSRKREIVFPRQICMYLIRGELKNSYPFIGERFGGRDHTTVMHACDKITKGIAASETLAEEINLIKSRLYS